MNRFLHTVIIGTALLVSSVTHSARATTSSADAATYFSNLADDEKETYTSWFTKQAAAYSRHSFMPSESSDTDSGAAFFWNINDDDTVSFALAVRADGWVGFGISEAGGMMGADMALYQVSKPDVLTDAHVVDNKSLPLTDDCQSWNLESVTNEDGWIIVEMSRLLDTNDSQDHKLINDEEMYMPPTRIIAAWGDSDTVSYHGGNKARSSVRLFANYSNDLTEMEALLENLEDKSDGHFGVFEDEFEIPAEETYYHRLCVTADELDLPEGQTSVTMIGAMPVITEETRAYVHHFTAYLVDDCSEASLITQSMVYAWAPGDEGWVLPEDVGFPLFRGNKQAVSIEIHYNNPDLIEGLKDDSGLKFYYTHNAREHEAGMLEIGDPWLSLRDENIDEGLTQYSFTCPGTCSDTFLAKERSVSSPDVTILSEFLHMHKSGIRMTNEVIRGDQVINAAVSDVYDFDQQGLYHVPQRPYKVMPGDSFRTTCYYKDGTSFGLGSKQEMCIAFILYWPARKVQGSPWICPYNPWNDLGTGCAAELEHTNLNSSDELGRNFGASGECASNSVAAPDPTESSADEAPATPSENDQPLTKKDTSGAGSFGMSPFMMPFVALLFLPALPAI